MPNIIEITDFNAPELDVYARLTEAQLLNRHNLKEGLFIAESPNVIHRALDAGYEPVSFLMERKHIEGQAKEVIARCGDIPVYTAEFDVLTQLTGFQLTRGMLCAMRRKPLPSVEAVLENARCPVVLDADGINVIAQHKDVLRGRQAPTVLTPHDGEFARLGGLLGEDRMAAAASVAKDLGCILLLKGHRTCITDGENHYINCTGNPGMAVGGSGDVLGGIIASLLGQGLAPLEAAAVGACLHGAAGDICARELGQYGMLPTDMLNCLPRLMK